jgi:hypothetical protein
LSSYVKKSKRLISSCAQFKGQGWVQCRVSLWAAALIALTATITTLAPTVVHRVVDAAQTADAAAWDQEQATRDTATDVEMTDLAMNTMKKSSIAAPVIATATSSKVDAAPTVAQLAALLIILS